MGSFIFLFFKFFSLKNTDSLMTPDGVGLPTALRVLCHIACPPPLVEGMVDVFVLLNTEILVFCVFCLNVPEV